jgi:hypothetical protein
MTKAKVVASLAALVMATAACGDPYARPKQPPPHGEQPESRPGKPRDRVSRRQVARTPEGAALRAAALTTNWTGETVARNYEQLARISIGAARRSALDALARLSTDPQMTAPGARSTGTVEAITTRRAAPRERQLLVVTHETVVADGLRDDRWRVTLAAVHRRFDGWAIVSWDPQP